MNEKPEPTEIERENRRNLRRLVLSMQASLGKLNLLVGICDNSQYRDTIVHSYETELQAKGVACYRVKIDRDRPSLKQVLLDWQDREPQLQSDSPKIVTVQGADTLLAIRMGEPKSPQEQFFFSAQWTREGLRQFQFPVVIWVTEAIARNLAQLAPDFWSWRGGVFEFRQPIGYTLPSVVGTTAIESSRESYSPEPIADPTELQQQIESLLAEDPDSPLLRSLYSSLGKIYYRRLEQGKATDYPQEQQHAIAAFQKSIDLAAEEDSELATDCSYLALLYESMGRYSEAEPLYVRSLSIRERQLGGDHPSTASSLNNLAGLYESMGRYSEAEPLYVRTLAILMQCLPENHPHIQTTRDNFRYLIQQAVENGKAAELSAHPATQGILKDMQN
ncbi:MAG: tetratricopeptide repeat protein [Geitlerinemataceae cyanobacterium]